MNTYRQFLLVLILTLPSLAAHAQSWSNQPTMKLKRAEATAVEYDGQLYVFNGFSKGLYVGNSIEKYNPDSKQWNLLANTSVADGTAVTHNGTVLVGNEAWLIGGRIGAHPGTVSDKVWVYNLDTHKWRAGPTLPEPMAGGGAALVNNKIYLFGGMDAQARCDVNFHYVYNLSDPSEGWKNITGTAPMPAARNHFSTAVIDDTIYAIGGQHNHDGCAGTPGGNVALVHSYRPQTNEWKRLANLPTIESHNEPSTFVHNGFIYTVGGATTGNKVLRYDTGTNQWEHIVNLPEQLLAPVARIYNGRLVVAGGGAPLARQSNNLVRSIGLTKFNDFASNHSGTSSTSNNNTNTNTNTNTINTGTNTTSGLIISVEAESFTGNTGTATHQWINATLPGASADASMTTTPNSGALKANASGSPKLSYRIQFDEAGTYHLWIRAWGDENANAQGSNDSLHAGLNGSLSNTADKIDGFPVGWHWSKRTRDGITASLNIPSPGVHSVNLWMREDGLAVDKFLLVKNDLYVPQGTGVDANQLVDNVATDSTTSDGSLNESGTVSDGVQEADANSDSTSSDGSSTNTMALVAIEAENYQSKTGAGTHNWVNGVYPDASGGKSMITTPNAGKLKTSADGSPKLSYSVTFAEPGSYYVWIRGWGDEQANGAGGNDSVHAGLNNALSLTADKIDGFPAGWHWSKRTRDGVPATIIVPSAGAHTFNLWMREDGFSVDKIILTKDASYSPAGLSAGDSQVSNNTNPSNTAPIVNAGANASIMETASLSLYGSVSDDGIPTTALTLLWSKTSGPGSVVFSNATSATTSVSFSAPGTYALQLTATDGELASSDTITVTVNADTSDTNLIDPNALIIAIEAEAYFTRTATPSHQWINANLAGASENASMITTPNSTTLKAGSAGAPMMGYLVNFSEPGEYYLWVRGWGDERSSGAGNNDSIHAGLNGALSSTADKIDGFPAGWHWSRRTRDGSPARLIVANAGTHSVNLWMREDGFAVDKFILTKDESYVPIGTGINGTSIYTTNESNTDNPSPTDTAQPTPSDNTFIADATTAWEMVQTVNGSAVVARHEAGAVAIDGTLYVMGGRGNRPVQSYSESVNGWTSHGKAPVLMHHFQPVAIGNKIYVIGAMKDDNFPTEKPLEYVYEFDASNHSWSKGVAIPANRRRGSVGAASYNGKIYLIGGNTNGHSGPAVKWFDEYNPATKQWRVMPDAPNARDHLTVAVAGGKLVVAAGRRSQHPNVIGDTEAKTDMYNFATGQWEITADNIPTKRAGTMTVAIGEEVVVIGGESVAHVNAHTEVEALNVSTGKWRTLQPLILGRHSGGAAVLGDKVHVVSGNTTRGGGNETINHETLLLD